MLFFEFCPSSIHLKVCLKVRLFIWVSKLRSGNVYYIGYVVTKCSFWYKSKLSLFLDERLYEHGPCGKHFKNKEILRNHSKICKKSQETSSSELQDSRAPAVGKLMIVFSTQCNCNACCFYLSADFKTFTCWCGKSYKYAGFLGNHQKTHMTDGN